MPPQKSKQHPVRLDRRLLFSAFQKALKFLTNGRSRHLSPRRVALEAYRFYGESLPPSAKGSSWFSFKRLVSGKSADGAIMRLMSVYDVFKSKRAAIDRAGVLAAFRRSVRELCTTGVTVRPLSVVQKAQEIYAAMTGSGSSPQKESAFEHFVYGRKADPEVVRILEDAGVRKRGKLNRSRLLASFREAVRELRSRKTPHSAGLMKVAEEAHRNYLRGLEEEALSPSIRTFRRLVSGRTADPSVKRIVESALSIPKENRIGRKKWE